MSVPRHTSAYGINRIRRRSWAQSRLDNQDWDLSTNAQDHLTDLSVRLLPIPGRKTHNWWYPTSWGTHIWRVEDRPYEYRYSGTRWARGQGMHSSYAVAGPRFASYTATGVSVNPPINIVNRARTEALNKLKNGKIDVGVALAESGETLRFIAQTASRAVNALRAIRRGDIAALNRILGLRGDPSRKRGQNVAENWLTYQYAVTPLLNDIYGAVEQFNEGFRSKDQIFKVTRQVSEPIKLEEWMTSYRPHHGDTLEGQARWVCKVVLHARVSNAMVLAQSQLGLINPALVAWELVPFSFVVDWFLPIGAWLESLTSTAGLEFVSGFEDRIVEMVMNVRSYSEPPSRNPTGANSFTCKQFSFERRLFTGFPWTLPYWKNPWSTSHVASALALVRALTGGSRQ